ncbi:MAG: insulinase family protein [Tannerellaceae bacterium]|nr:insulinase family protein [Tannerellaceae bacterium]
MKHFLFMTLVASAIVAPARAGLTDNLRVTEHILSNGLTVWLNPDTTQTKVMGAVIVKAGAKDCPDTGIAHYFEHMMFKGTDKIGTMDYEAERPIQEAIEARYDELARTKEERVRQQLQQEINELTVKQAEYIIPNEFNRLISKYGGTNLNAGTSYDFTVYYNMFSPQYIVQWAELNSERLLNPVFRLFQNELETVYEEKNMYGDFIGGQAMERLMKRYFEPHPYAYPIIGSTENLKNPCLSEMRRFFEKYYVASNMALILSGNIDMETILPILENTFSRIPRGEAPQREVVAVPPFKGKEKMAIKLPVPLVKASGFGFRGAPAFHPDQAALSIAVRLLNNASGTGYLDRLMVDRKLMAAMVMNEALNEAGILVVGALPRLVLQTTGSAEKLVWKEIERIKKGDFSDDLFNSLKLELKREYATALENLDARGLVMMRLFSQGKKWKDYLAEIDRPEQPTRDDVVRVAQQYFGTDYLYVKKKTGKYPKDDLPKPEYAPVVPYHAEAVSAYARKLDEMPVLVVEPHFINFDTDVTTVELSPLAALYIAPNPLNDIFTLFLSYRKGTLEEPLLKQLANYLPFLGTEGRSFNEFRTKLQAAGGSLTFEANERDFMVRISGFDIRFPEVMELVGEFFTTAKADQKKISQLAEEARVTRKAFEKSSDDIAAAVLEKIKYGDQSRYLTQLSHKEVKKLKGEQLTDLFKEIQTVQCDLHYAGNLPVEQVVGEIERTLPVQLITLPESEYRREKLHYTEPLVFFLNLPDVLQSIIYGYLEGDTNVGMEDNYISRLFNGYFGDGMSSVLFQEIREFRSFAYRVRGTYKFPPLRYKSEPGDFTAILSTQADKTVDAMGVFDSLLKEMPIKPEKIATVKQTLVNQVNNDYPSFRHLSEKIVAFKRDGYVADPYKGLLDRLPGMQIEDVTGFYERHIQGHPAVYVVVGNEKRIDMEGLARFGQVRRIKIKEIYR